MRVQIRPKPNTLLLTSCITIIHVLFRPENLNNKLVDFCLLQDYFLQPIDTLAAMSRNKTRVQLVILRACLCYLDKLAAAGCAKNFNLNSLANSWKNCDVMKTTTTIDITRNILTVRWVRK